MRCGLFSGARKVLKSSTSLMVVSTRSTLPCLSYIFTEFSPTRCLIRTPTGRRLTSLTTSAFQPWPQVAVWWRLAAEEAHHVRAEEGGQAMLHQFGIQMRQQRRRLAEHDVGGPLALI